MVANQESTENFLWDSQKILERHIAYGLYWCSSVVIQFLSGVFPLTEMAGFTPFLLQFLALRPSTCLVSEHPPPSNQPSLSPLPLASFRSSSVVLAFSCQSLQDSEQPSKHYRHPSLVHVSTVHISTVHVKHYRHPSSVIPPQYMSVQYISVQYM